MFITHSFPHNTCKHYIEEYYIGFRIVTPSKGETYEGLKYEYNTLVFLLEGEVTFSYDNFLNRHFTKGDIFFVPQASMMYSTALVDSKLLVLTFNTRVDSVCDACSLLINYGLESEVRYSFSALKMDQTLWNFAAQIQDYMKLDMRCSFLHTLKQRELFVILQYIYTREELRALFYPAVGASSFKSWVLENYKLDLTMEALADKCNMGVKSFSRKFQKDFGVNFRQWILKQKAKQVELKLSMPGVTTSDMVREFHFTDSKSFYRFCKEQIGSTPSQIIAKTRL